jgi:hypothetical protein
MSSGVLNYGNVYLVNTEISPDQKVQKEREKAVSGFVEAYNTANTNAPFQFKSHADYLAYKRAKAKQYCSTCS